MFSQLEAIASDLWSGISGRSFASPRSATAGSMEESTNDQCAAREQEGQVLERNAARRKAKFRARDIAAMYSGK